jgi:chloramphenicol 3-O phosphotransferase
MSQILFLNGASSSGKSSIAKAIQELDDKPWLVLGVDTFIDLMPAAYTPGGSKAAQGMDFVTGANANGPTLEVSTGPYGKKVFNACALVAKTLADQGLDLIIDEVLLSKDEFAHYKNQLTGHIIYFVKVACDLATLQSREQLRGNRLSGLANAQFSLIDLFEKEYDLVVDTTKNSAVECAEQIIQSLA